MIQATTWITLEDIKLSAINQSQRTSIVCFHLDEMLRIVTSMDTDSGTLVTRCWGRGNGEFVFNEYRGSAWADEKVLKMDGGDPCTTV